VVDEEDVVPVLVVFDEPVLDGEDVHPVPEFGADVLGNSDGFTFEVAWELFEPFSDCDSDSFVLIGISPAARSDDRVCAD
jgi:hypothetical protein